MNCASIVARKSVLAIDGELMILEVMEEILGRSVEVFDTATDGLDGYAKLLKKDYDRIFIDLMTPGIGGMELLRLIKQVKPHLLRNMVFIAGGIESDDVRRMIRSNGCRIIDKPFMVQEIYSAL